MSETTPPRGVTTDDAETFAGLIAPGRLIGIDAGTKTLGLALSDTRRAIASALETIRRTKFTADAKRLLDLTQEHGVAGFVLGLPANMDGSEGPRCQSVRQFAKNLLAMADIDICFWDERLSTVAAERARLPAPIAAKLSPPFYEFTA